MKFLMHKKFFVSIEYLYLHHPATLKLKELNSIYYYTKYKILLRTKKKSACFFGMACRVGIRLEKH